MSTWSKYEKDQPWNDSTGNIGGGAAVKGGQDSDEETYFKRKIIIIRYRWGNMLEIITGEATCSSPRCPLRSHSPVCRKNHLFIVGMGPIFDKEL